MADNLSDMWSVLLINVIATLMLNFPITNDVKGVMFAA